jgi:hypothetical protein
LILNGVSEGLELLFSAVSAILQQDNSCFGAGVLAALATSVQVYLGRALLTCNLLPLRSRWEELIDKLDEKYDADND